MGSWRDHDRDISNYHYQEKKKTERLNAKLKEYGPIGAIDSESGKLIVGYRSRAGRLGKYLLLEEREKTNFISGRCKLGFFGGRLMPDGKDGFEVSSERVMRTPEEAEENPNGPETRTVFDEEGQR